MPALPPDGAHSRLTYDLGRPGASARAEFDRRRARDDRRRREIYGPTLGRLITLLTIEPQSTSSWGSGGRAEERVGDYLANRVGRHGLVLHDRIIPGRRSNIDHIAIVASGVWVIDTKHYKGKITRGGVGRWFGARPLLFVNGHNRTTLISAVLGQRDLVRAAVGAHVPVRAALCFAGTGRMTLAQPFAIDEVAVTRPNRLVRSLLAPGPLDEVARHALAGRLHLTFPPYAPSGTSHKPTGA